MNTDQQGSGSRVRRLRNEAEGHPILDRRQPPRTLQGYRFKVSSFFMTVPWGVRHGLQAATLLAAMATAGCAQLLPTAHTGIESAWTSFDEARRAIDRIEPGRTSTAQLRALGIDPHASPNVQLLTYSDILLRFPVSGSSSHPDAGLRECLEAGKRCTGYYINVRKTQRSRIGGFWEDTLGFKRVVEVSGWSFNSLVLVVGDRVVYTLYGGQPNLREHEVTRQPLGPVQDFGESLPLGRLVR